MSEVAMSEVITNEDTKLVEGLVTCRAGAKLEVWVPEKQRFYTAFLRGRLRMHGAVVYAGDWVEGEVISGFEFAVDGVRERRNFLPKPRVANVDRLMVVVSWDEPVFSNTTVDGLLVLAEYFGLSPVLVINKVDLVRVRQKRKFEHWVDLYRGLGYDVVPISVASGEGVEKLRERLCGQLVVLAGPSGVGKSSILNAIIPGVCLRVGEVSEKTGRGRHTTTEVRLLQNPNGGWVADTPGFQKVDVPLWVEARNLPRLYREFGGFRCQFNDCSHTVEPGCAVREAVEKGEISKERFNSYIFWLNQIKELRASK